MAIAFPADCITGDDKLEYCQRGEELLRQLYNAMGAWRSGGIPEDVYLQMPEPFRAALTSPRDSALPIEQWLAFRDYYKAREKELMAETNQHRDQGGASDADPVLSIRNAIKVANRISVRWADQIFKDAL